jgi:hypothetical protein
MWICTCEPICGVVTYKSQGLMRFIVGATCVHLCSNRLQTFSLFFAKSAGEEAPSRLMQHWCQRKREIKKRNAHLVRRFSAIRVSIVSVVVAASVMLVERRTVKKHTWQGRRFEATTQHALAQRCDVMFEYLASRGYRTTEYGAVACALLAHRRPAVGDRCFLVAPEPLLFKAGAVSRNISPRSVQPLVRGAQDSQHVGCRGYF